MDPIRTIKDDPIVLFKIHGLLLKLNKLEVPNPIADFILNFEPLLEEGVQVIRLKWDFINRLKELRSCLSNKTYFLNLNV